MTASASSARDWRETLRGWAAPPSDTENQKASNAVGMIRDAIRASATLHERAVDVYVTGSYRNNTNARLESDVDVAVVSGASFFHDSLPAGLTFDPASYSFDAFRDDVAKALTAKFGGGVTPGAKAFHIRENTYRLDADVAVFFPHRRYTGRTNPDGTHHYHAGVEMRPRGASQGIINWHQHHYDQGVAKNDATGGRFKRITRILKRLRADMIEHGTQAQREAATPMASFLIESLAYNAPNETFNQTSETYYDDTRAVVTWLWNRVQKNEHGDFKEVSEMKWLFRSGQAWTAEQVKAFLSSAWGYVGFQ